MSERGHVSPTRVLVLPLCRQARERPCEVPVEWMLWTSAPIEGFEQALAALHGYARPWGASGSSTAPSKSGLRIEDRPLVSSDNWHQCLALDRVVAWRIEHLERLPRRHAETPAGVVLEERNCRVLAACCQDNGRSIDALFVAA